MCTAICNVYCNQCFSCVGAAMHAFTFVRTYMCMSPLCSTECTALQSFPALLAGETVNRDPEVMSYTSLLGQPQDREGVRSPPSPLPCGTCYASPGPADEQAEPGIRSMAALYSTQCKACGPIPVGHGPRQRGSITACPSPGGQSDAPYHMKPCTHCQKN